MSLFGHAAGVSQHSAGSACDPLGLRPARPLIALFSRRLLLVTDRQTTLSDSGSGSDVGTRTTAALINARQSSPQLRHYYLSPVLIVPAAAPAPNLRLPSSSGLVLFLTAVCVCAAPPPENEDATSPQFRGKWLDIFHSKARLADDRRSFFFVL